MRQAWLLDQSLHLVPVRNGEARADMEFHYSQPKGFVGRNIVYSIVFGDTCYGTIAGGSATAFLPGREEIANFRNGMIGNLNNGVNNIFFHVEKRGGRYPARNFTVTILKLYRETIERDWRAKYGDEILWHETLVELPRTGECYRRDGWTRVGQTKGYTCKRTAGKGTDSWSGKRVWDTKNLRPKHVFLRITGMETKIKGSDQQPTRIGLDDERSKTGEYGEMGEREDVGTITDTVMEDQSQHHEVVRM